MKFPCQSHAELLQLTRFALHCASVGSFCAFVRSLCPARVSAARTVPSSRQAAHAWARRSCHGKKQRPPPLRADVARQERAARIIFRAGLLALQGLRKHFVATEFLPAVAL